MHSLKNTIVAVGLLGLSFVFYQFSSQQPPADDQLMSPFAEQADSPNSQTELPAESDKPTSAPAEPSSAKLDIAARQPIANPLAENKPNPLSPIPKVDIPQIELPAPKAGGLNLGGGDFSAPEINSERPDFSSQASVESPQPRQQTPLELDSKLSSNPTASAAPDRSPETSKSLDLTPNPDNAQQRDQGLIAMLEQQKKPPASESTDSSKRNQFVANPYVDSSAPTGVSDADKSFQLQPSNDKQFGATNDGSFNQKAATEIAEGESNHVVNADSAPTATQPISTGESALPTPSEFSSIAFPDAFPIVNEMVERELYRDALELLSQYYQDDSLTGPQRQALMGWLDGLAGKVVFSREHHLAKSHQFQPSESLGELARTWNVPEQLIRNVNGVTTDGAALAGMELKVIPGPFDAHVDLENKTMTLFLGKLYAGRFALRVGISGDPRPGEYKVMMKNPRGNDWKNASNQLFPPGDPNNHYGPYFIGLEDFLCIHQVDESKQDGHYGCLGLVAQDAQDVFSILSVGSTIRIR